MNTRTLTIARAIALLTGIAVAYVIISEMVKEIQEGIFVFTEFFGYFTMQSGVLLSIIMIATAFAPTSALQSSSRLAWARGAVTLYAAMTAPIFYVLVSPPVGRQFEIWDINHAFAPLMALVLWFGLLRPKTPGRWWWPLPWVAYPLLYTVVSLIRGSFDGWYPYEFLNVGANGWPSVLQMIGMLAVAFCAVGYLLLLPGIIARRRQRTAV